MKRQKSEQPFLGAKPNHTTAPFVTSTSGTTFNRRTYDNAYTATAADDSRADQNSQDRIYQCPGSQAHARAARRDQTIDEDARREREEMRRFRQEQEANDKRMNAACRRIETVISGLLYGAGCHKHKRQWRKEQMKKNTALTKTMAEKLDKFPKSKKPTIEFIILSCRAAFKEEKPAPEVVNRLRELLARRLRDAGACKFCNAGDLQKDHPPMAGRTDSAGRAGGQIAVEMG
jgi:hypothetical protein